MTRYDAIRRQLGDIEKAHERALAKREMQIRLLCAYRDQLEDRVDIAARLLTSRDCSLDDALKSIDDEYEIRQAARKVALGERASCPPGCKEWQGGCKNQPDDCVQTSPEHKSARVIDRVFP
jgi:hypothetical protein